MTAYLIGTIGFVTLGPLLVVWVCDRHQRQWRN
jgi:hypothetical protein